jgi:Zn-dependent alcohol dehydrogenase
LISRGALPVGSLATHVLDLGEIQKAYDLMQSGESLRAVLKPEEVRPWT